MKKLTIVFTALLISAVALAFDPGGIDEKLIRSFNTSFPKAEQVNWYELPKTYVVNFVENGIRGRIEYPKGLGMTRYTRYYTEQFLPFVVQSSIRKMHPNKSVYGVIEVSIVSETTESAKVEYYVKLQDARYWTTVKADMDGTLKTVERIKKQ